MDPSSDYRYFAEGGTPVGAPFVVFHAVIDEATAGGIDICVPIAPDVDVHVTSPGSSCRPRYRSRSC